MTRLDAIDPSTPSPEVHEHHEGPPPSPWLMAMEFRAFWEFGAIVPFWPLLQRAPMGDGHPVIVFPGLSASDGSTVPLRGYLSSRNYAVSGWNQGHNFGPRAGVLEAGSHQIHETFLKAGKRKVSLIGWSLGGLYARELAKELPDHVRCVITLGTPFTGHPRATNAWRFFELVSGQSVHDPQVLAQLRREPPVPTTSIWSRSDGIVAWRCSVVAPGPQAENIELHASHVGMGMNPLALYAIADRLAQPAGHWKPFEPHGARRWFFRTPHAEAKQAT